MKIKLSDHFTYGRLLRFTLPSVVMMVIASIYSVVDGLFVSNLVGDMALSAVNIIFPVAMIIGAFMLGTGGSAIVARTLGEGRRELAQRYFSMIIYAVILLGGVLTVVSVWLTEPIARLAGASDALIRDCVVYGRILLLGSVPFMLQVCFQSFFVVAERPQLGLAYSIAAGPIWCWTMCSSRCSIWGSQGRPSLPCWGMLWAASFRCSILPRGSVPACG